MDPDDEGNSDSGDVEIDYEQNCSDDQGHGSGDENKVDEIDDDDSIGLNHSQNSEIENQSDLSEGAKQMHKLQRKL